MIDFLNSLHSVSLIVTVAAAVLLGGLLAWNLYRPSFGFWPAGEEAPIRHHTAFGLFRIFCGGTVIFALLEIGAHGWGHWSRYVVGVPLMAVAFGITLWGYKFLGIENTYCESDGLVTGGMYEYSRNPQYVADLAILLGFGLLFSSIWAWGVLEIGIAALAIAPVAEEQGLHEQYGKQYDDYRSETRRFL